MSRFDFTKLRTRFITAIILAPIALFAIYSGGWLFWILVAVFFGLAQYELYWLMRKIEGLPMLYPAVFVYLCVCFAAFLMVGSGRNAEALVLMVMVIASDVGAYFFGKLIGGPKMAKRISPNKTWAGLVGAVLCPALVLFCYESFAHWNHESLHWGILLTYLIFGGIIGLSGQAGDILVSLLKRMAKVKDTGTLLPGHGGALDRIDSLMLASVAFIALEYVLYNV